MLRDGALLGVGHVTAALGGLVGLKLLTSLVSPETYGEVALLVGLATLGRNFFCSPVLLASLRFFPEAKRAQRVLDLRRILGRAVTAGTLATAIVLTLSGFIWTRFNPEGLPFLGFLAVAFLLGFEVVQALETGLLNADRQQGVFAAWTALSSWTRPLFGVGAVLLLGSSTLSVIFGFAIGLAVPYRLFHRRLVRGEVGAGSGESWSASTRAGIRRYALPLIPLAALGWVMSLGDRYILAAWNDASAVGLYAAVYGLGSQPFTKMGGVLHNTFRPRLFNAVAEGDQAGERRIFLLFLGAMVGVSIAGVIGVTLAADWLAHIFLGAAFWSAAPLIPWIAGAFALQNVQQVFETEIYAQKKTHLLLIMQGSAAGTALGLYLLLIPALGAKGAALGTFFSMAVSCLVAIWLSGVVPRLLRR